LHNIFEQLATSNDLAFQPEKLSSLIDTYIESNMESFYYLKADVDSFIKEIKSAAQKAQEWVITYLSKTKSIL